MRENRTSGSMGGGRNLAPLVSDPKALAPPAYPTATFRATTRPVPRGSGSRTGVALEPDASPRIRFPSATLSRVETTVPLTDPAPRTFFGVPSLRDLDTLDAQVAFLGVPYDGGTPQPGIATGQRAGPTAAREATQVEFYYPRSVGPGGDQGAEGWYDVESDRDYLVGVTMADVGDVAIQGSDTEANYERITGAARGIAERGALMVAMGGDHSISYPLGRGMEPLGQFHVVHVDAHTDFLDELDGARLTGASQLRRLAELPFVD